MIIWAIIGLLIVVINFISNEIVNTNCRYTYGGNIVVIVGALVGMSGRPTIAASLVFFGCLIVIYGKIIAPDRKRTCRQLK